MAEFRQNQITKEWIFIASQRPEKIKLNHRPSIYADLPTADPACVFCPGNETLNPDPVLSLPNEKKWRVRVVKGKFFSHKRQTQKGLHSDHHVHRPGPNEYEVVVFKDHNKPLTRLSEIELEILLKAWQTRLYSLNNRPEVKYVQILHNHGQEAGATFVHPNCQIVALPMIPSRLHQIFQTSIKHYQLHGTCLHCDLVKTEIDSQIRIIEQNKDFIAYLPYAGRFPYQIQIIPLVHQADFTELKSSERHNLALILRSVLGRLLNKLEDPPFNIVLQTLPKTDTSSSKMSFHWHLEIWPRLRSWSGFDLNTDIAINPVAPEEAAELLRK